MILENEGTQKKVAGEEREATHDLVLKDRRGETTQQLQEGSSEKARKGEEAICNATKTPAGRKNRH